MEYLVKALTIILFTTYCFADKDGVPVFVIDDKDVTSHWNTQADPFKKVSTAYFSDIVSESAKRSACVIIFVEEHLSTEDISLKDASGTPYYYIRKRINGNEAKYLPSVSQPYKILTYLFPSKQSNLIYVSSAEKFVLPNNYLKYFFVNFQDSLNGTRIQSLRLHDTIMNQIINKVKAVKRGPILAFYTGKRNPVSIEKINFSIKFIRSEGNDIIKSEKALFRLTGVYSETPLRTVRYTEQPEVTRDHGGKDTHRSWTDIAYTDFELRFIFDHTENSWMLSGVALLEGNQIVGTTSTISLNVGAPLGMSSVCAAPIVVRNKRDESSVIITKYQIQSFRRTSRYDDDGDDNDDGGQGGNDEGNGGKGGGEAGSGGEGVNEGSGSGGGENSTNTNTNDTNKISFGKSVDCEPYFNTPILTGLFLTAIFLCIFAYGIMFLMDCQSNDRYDDPNGKEIMSKADLAQTEF